MYYDIEKFSFIEDYKVELFFSNGKRGVINFKDYINKGGVFNRFKDYNYFKNLELNKEIKNIVWPNGLDISPESLYSKATGESLPEWMVNEEKENYNTGK